MEDTEEGNGGQWGSRRERNIEEDREGGEMEGDREGWRGKERRRGDDEEGKDKEERGDRKKERDRVAGR